MALSSLGAYDLSKEQYVGIHNGVGRNTNFALLTVGLINYSLTSIKRGHKDAL